MVETVQWKAIYDSEPPSVVEFQDNIISQHNLIQFPNYRIAFKLIALRKRTLLHLLDIQGYATVWKRFNVEFERLYKLKLLSQSEAQFFSNNFEIRQDAELTYANLGTFLKITYDYLKDNTLRLQELEEAKKFTFDFLIHCFDRPVENSIKLSSVQVLIILLCRNKILDRARYFCRTLSSPDGKIVLNSIPYFLCDLFQILDGLGEGQSYGSTLANIEKFRLECFGKLSLFTRCSNRDWVSQNEFLSLLIQEPVPECLQWLSVWERVEKGIKERHSAKCACCAVMPIIGIRFKCSSCRKYNLCQDCFLTRKTGRRHKSSHVMKEKVPQTFSKSKSRSVKLKPLLITEQPIPHVHTPILGRSLSRIVTRQSLSASSSQFSLLSVGSSDKLESTMESSLVANDSCLVEMQTTGSSIEQRFPAGVSNTPEFVDKQNFAISPIKEEKANSPLLRKSRSPDTLSNEACEEVFDSLLSGLEAWIDEQNGSVYQQESTSIDLSLGADRKQFIFVDDSHLPRLSDMLITENISSIQTRKVNSSTSTDDSLEHKSTSISDNTISILEQFPSPFRTPSPHQATHTTTSINTNTNAVNNNNNNNNNNNTSTVVTRSDGGKVIINVTKTNKRRNSKTNEQTQLPEDSKIKLSSSLQSASRNTEDKRIEYTSPQITEQSISQPKDGVQMSRVIGKVIVGQRLEATEEKCKPLIVKLESYSSKESLKSLSDTETSQTGTILSPNRVIFSKTIKNTQVANNNKPTNGQTSTSYRTTGFNNKLKETNNGHITINNKTIAPTSVNGQIGTINVQRGTINGQSETINRQTGTINGQTGTINGQSETINGQTGTINGQSKTINGQTGIINGQTGIVNGQTVTINGQTGTINGQSETINGQTGTINGQSKTINGQTGTINGHLSTTNGQISTILGQKVTTKMQIPITNVGVTNRTTVTNGTQGITNRPVLGYVTSALIKAPKPEKQAEIEYMSPSRPSSLCSSFSSIDLLTIGDRNGAKVEKYLNTNIDVESNTLPRPNSSKSRLNSDTILKTTIRPSSNLYIGTRVKERINSLLVQSDTNIANAAKPASPVLSQIRKLEEERRMKQNMI